MISGTHINGVNKNPQAIAGSGFCRKLKSLNKTIYMSNLCNSLEEIWKDVPGFEGLYEVSNYGRVKSLPRPWYRKKQSNILVGVPDINGYLKVPLNNHGKYSVRPIHRLVAIAFIPNPENKPYVNHIDGNPSNARVENLEWVTPLENSQHAWSTGLMHSGKSSFWGKSGANSHVAKAVNQYSKTGELLNTYPTVLAASKAIGCDHSFLCKAASGKHEFAYGFKWEYAKN